MKIEELVKTLGFKGDINPILQSIRENQKLLDGCQLPHDFSVPLNRRTKEPMAERVFGCDWGCSKCKGWVSHERKMWYELGLIHGK